MFELGEIDLLLHGVSERVDISDICLSTQLNVDVRTVHLPLQGMVH
jgi:hypothetical protein